MTTRDLTPTLTNGLTFRRLHLTDGYTVTLWDTITGTVCRGLDAAGRPAWFAYAAAAPSHPAGWPVGLTNGYPTSHPTRRDAANALVRYYRGEGA